MAGIPNIFRKPYEWNTAEGAKFWLSDVQKYGQSPYVEGVLALLERRGPKKVFELGLGNGFPLAATLLQKGVEVHGCDISFPLLQEVEKKYPQVRWHQGGYEDLVPKTSGQQYDIVYCVRTSWYFPNIFLAIDNMLAITKSGGAVVFDIMNASSPKMKQLFWIITYKRVRMVVKNALKFVLNRVFHRSYAHDNTIFSKDYMVRSRDIDHFLEQKNVLVQTYTFEQLTGTASLFDQQSFRILYVVEKK